MSHGVKYCLIKMFFLQKKFFLTNLNKKYMLNIQIYVEDFKYKKRSKIKLSLNCQNFNNSYR